MTFQIRPFFLQKTNLNRTRETNFNPNLTLEFFIFQSRSQISRTNFNLNLRYFPFPFISSKQTVKPFTNSP